MEIKLDEEFAKDLAERLYHTITSAEMQNLIVKNQVSSEDFKKELRKYCNHLASILVEIVSEIEVETIWEKLMILERILLLLFDRLHKKATLQFLDNTGFRKNIKKRPATDEDELFFDLGKLVRKLNETFPPIGKNPDTSTLVECVLPWKFLGKVDDLLKPLRTGRYASYAEPGSDINGIIQRHIVDPIKIIDEIVEYFQRKKKSSKKDDYRRYVSYFLKGFFSGKDQHAINFENAVRELIREATDRADDLLNHVLYLMRLYGVPYLKIAKFVNALENSEIYDLENKEELPSRLNRRIAKYCTRNKIEWPPH